MGIFKQFLYTNTGTEIEFMQGLIDLICGLDDGITCVDTDGNPTTAAAQYADLTSASKAKFLFNFGNGITAFHLERGSTNNNNISYFYCSNYGHAPAFSQQSYAVMTNATRSFRIAYYKGDDFIWFALGHYYSADVSALMHSFGLIKANNSRYVGFVDSPNVSIMTTSFTDNNITATFTNLFPYSAEVGKIDYSSKMPVLSGEVKQFEIQSILPCSTVALWSNISLPNRGNFYAIGTNALVPIDDE